MTKFTVISADPPWKFSDGLKMSKTKRGAGSQYDELNIKEIKALPVSKIAADDAILVLWVPGSFLEEGMDTMKAWGFNQKQVHVWVKVKKDPIEILTKSVSRVVRALTRVCNGKTPFPVMTQEIDLLEEDVKDFKLSNILAFGMGRLFRQTHEIALIGTRGKIHSKLKNKSQRSVHFGQVLKHSAKPEDLQDMLEVMFPGAANDKVELFARRSRKNWVCLGNQSPETMDEDIRDSLKNLITKEEAQEHEESVINEILIAGETKRKIMKEWPKDWPKEYKKYILKKLK